jgi:hypothetical protein
VAPIIPNITATNFAPNAIGKRPSFEGREKPRIDPPEMVAEKISELIKSEEAELRV